MNFRSMFSRLSIFCCAFLACSAVPCAGQSSSQSSPASTQEASQPPVKPNDQNDQKEKKGVAQSPKPQISNSASGTGRENALGLQFIKNLVHDQRAIWESPAHVRLGEVDWLVPLGGITAGFLVTDRDASSHLSHTPSTLKHYSDFSNYGLAGMAGAVGGLYLLGKATDNGHEREAGILSGEAALNGLFVTTLVKYAAGRERPNVDSFRGRFWQGGTSFPSGHATISWAFASVLTHEYPGPLTKLFAYGAASAISFARVRGEKHFPSDVLVGSGIGWLAGWQAYRAHHNAEVGGGVAESLSDSPLVETDRTPAQMGSAYVPLDSWIYPLFDRLIAMGVINSAIQGMRPWTRLECARLVAEAGESLQDADPNGEVSRAYEMLEQEFAPESTLLGGGNNRAARVESVYTRFTEISGPPLTDGYHFGQTLINDFGRPFQEGFNNVSGFSGWATAGRWVVYARSEYQHAPGGPANSTAVQSAIAAIDKNPVFPSTAVPARDQARLLDAYVGLNLGNWQLSYGQQSQWWSPGESGPLLFSDNAAPVRMFHIDRVSPFRLPSFMRFLGPMRWDAFFGAVQGTEISNPTPYFHGEKISFKPTRNLEFGFTRTVMVGGQGRPLTLDRMFRSYFSVTSVNNETPANDPGKRTGGFDFRYRVPLLRKWLTIYTDSIADDDPSPLAAPRRAGVTPGLYISQFPGLNKLDLRVEAPLTDTVSTNGAGHFFYWDSFYHDLYTNRGFLMGNWIGRDGSGLEAWTRYWLTPRNRIQFGYRHAKVDAKFIPGGGTINDASVRTDFWVRTTWGVSAFVQYEQWRFPLLAPGPQTNVTGALQVTYWPQKNFHF